MTSKILPHTLEMSHQPIETPPSPILGPEQPLIEKTFSETYMTKSTIVPPTGAMTPGYSSQLRWKKRWIRRFIPRPSVTAFIVLISMGVVPLLLTVVLSGPSFDS